MRQPQSNFLFNGNRFHRQLFGYGLGFSPYFYGGYGNYGYPYLSPFYSSPNSCDPRFSSDDYCQTLYPNTPPLDDSQNFEYTQSRNSLQDSTAGPEPISANDFSRPVTVTYDGATHLTAKSGSTLVISSGQHTLLITSPKSE